MKRRASILLGVLGLVVVVLLAFQTPVLSSARASTWLALTTITSNVFQIGDLTVDNDVSAQLDNLTTENIRLQAELADYYTLREQLESPALPSHRAIPALVSARPLNPWRSELQLNRGVKDGVTLNAPVVTNGSILIGFITDLSDNTATCRLLSHPATSMPAEIIADNNVRGLLRGTTHTTISLGTIPRNAEIRLGQPVVTVGDESIPPGLLLGRIDDITAEENEAYQEARVTLPYTPNDLRGVSILVEP